MALPNIINVADQKALNEAVDRVMGPYVDEIREKIKEVKKKSSQPEEEFNRGAFLYSVKRIEEAVAQVTRANNGEEGPSNVEVVEMITGFRKADKNLQDKMVEKILKNDKVNQEFMATLVTNVHKSFKDMLKVTEGDANPEVSQDEAIKDLLDKINNRGDKRDRKDRTDDAEDRVVNDEKKNDSSEGGFFKKLLDFLTKNDAGSFVSEIMQGVSKLAFGIGAIGLVSMLPEGVKDFMGKLTASFVFAKKIIETGFLSNIVSIFSKVPILGTLAKTIQSFFGGTLAIFSKLPIIGAIIKKLPLLSYILAAFDILPKMLEKYKVGGMWAALEEGLQGIYKFFVNDVLELISQLIDYLQVKIFGVELFDTTELVKEFSAIIRDSITHLFNAFKALFNLDFTTFFTEIGLLSVKLFEALSIGFVKLFQAIDFEALKDLAVDLGTKVFNLITTKIKDLFESIDFSAMADAAADWAKDIFNSLLSSFKSALPDWITGGPEPDEKEKSLLKNNNSSKVEEKTSTIYTVKENNKDAVLLVKSLEDYIKRQPSYKPPSASNNVNVDAKRINNNHSMTMIAPGRVTSSGPLESSNGKYR